MVAVAVRWASVVTICFASASILGGCSDDLEPLGELAAVEVSAGQRHTCARFASGDVACWGTGTLGDGGVCEEEPCSTTPVLVSDLNDAVSVSVGPGHTCAVRAAGDVVCWGLSTWGDDALIETHETPRTVPGISNAVAVSSANLAACALLSTGEVVCWGLAIDGLLGDGEEDHEYCHPNGLTCSRTPVQVATLVDVSGISVRGYRACAIETSGRIACWGVDSHMIDEESTTDETHWTPVEIAGVTDAIAVSSGHKACALTTAGAATCWTAYDDDPPSIPTMPGTPQVVPGLAAAVAFDVGGGHSCAVHESGRVSCWGRNSTGQLGDGGTSADVPEPVRVRGIADAVSVSAGGGYTCAVRATGHLSCWGANSLGQLGDGTTVGQFEPVDVAWP